MVVNDYERFTELWLSVHQSMAGGKILSSGAMELCFDVLMDYPFDLVKKATRAHMKNAKFAPTPADIIELLETKNKRPTADEAWSIVPKDDANGYEITVIWTQEMAQGWASVCKDYQTDKVGARMSFKAIYERLCNEAVLMGKPIEWILAIGTDKEQQKAIIERGIADGKLIATPTLKAKLLELDPTKQTVAGLIAKSGNVIDAQKWKMARDLLEQADNDEKERKRIEREQADAKKQAVIEHAENLQKQQEEMA
jgi:hypothetical protein